MPDFGAWMNWTAAGNLEEWYRQSDRGDSVAFMIGHRGVSLTISRAGWNLPAQTCLLVPAGRSNSTAETGSASGTAAKEQLLVVGLADFNIKRGDKFSYPATVTRFNYEVMRVEKTLTGMIQAFAEEMQ